jgi:ring-1,2-phenylacetyl-CoA epoxidase subunit PaaC
MSAESGPPQGAGQQQGAGHPQGVPLQDPDVREALCEYLLAWADDELVLGHRDSEWTGFAPIIEEDVAFSSIAQDELGHAALLYGLAAELLGDDADRLALRRPADAYRHAALVERPNGDWAFTIGRHYLYDLADACRTEALSRSAYAPLAAAARKMAREEHYHLMHGAAWWDRLRDGTAESRARLLAAARDVAPLALDLFGPTPRQELLVAAGIVPDPLDLLDTWRTQTTDLLAALDPALPPLLDAGPAPRMARPVTPDFAALHAEMTMVSAAGIGEKW